MFATNGGTVRRNELSDFVEVSQNGKIAMKLDEGDRIVGVEICTENDDVLLTSAEGQASASPSTMCACSRAANSTGVRGIRLEGEDQVISMAILRHVEATADERAAYLSQATASARRRGRSEEPEIDAEESRRGASS